MLKPHVTLSEQTAMTKPLSPAAQAVLEAAMDYTPTMIDARLGAAAALRAAADQLGYHRAPGVDLEDLYGRIVDVDELLAIAGELEGTDG